MRAEDLHEVAARRADELPGAELTHPFGPDWDVYKVRGKVFMLQGARGGEVHVTLKSAPEDARALRESYEDITAGYHMNKKHWITVYAGGSLDEELLRELVTESYVLVLEGIPRRDRPVDPARFAHRSAD
ncbi:MmcQ/YjbR family DNA-binding protein [Microbacterium sp. GXS0129]|uniref:MmcQ/YjbR family DNA-binding protein n=1 Tax=Microbacterium sp. GXS0129 TaxID=3377836 RepID=UPI00383B75E0